jgi:hypothetical protein
MSGGHFTDVVGYGARATRDDPVVLASAPLALRVRPLILAGDAASGVGSLGLLAIAARSASGSWGDASLLEAVWMLVFGEG